MELPSRLTRRLHRTLTLPLDDCLYALQPSIPHLTRSALHRCLQRHGISRLPDVEGDKPKRQRFKRYPIGFFHIDIAEVQTAEGKLYLFVGIDRTSKFAVTQLVDKADRRTAWEFLEHLLKAVPYRIHTILTDNGIQFADQPRNRNTAWSRQMRFDMICEANAIEHRLTKPNHPWTNDQVERMNRTIRDATVKRFHYDSHDQLRTYLADFMAAYNFARRLKTLSGLTPYEYIAKIWTSEPDRFIVDPIHQMPGLNTQGTRYPAIGQSWRRAQADVIPFFAFPDEVLRIIYTTNAIEALNSKLRRAVRARGHFPSDEAATKLLYLILNCPEKEWRIPPREWTMAKAQFAVIFGERFIKAMAA